MSEPFLGEIRMFGGNFAPRGWAFCQGQLLSIAQNSALFALLGTMYGGNGQTTFGLPDLRGRYPRGIGIGPGISPVTQGQLAGSENVTILQTQMPQHVHTAQGISVSVSIPANTTAGTTKTPGDTLVLGQTSDTVAGAEVDIYNAAPGTTHLAPFNATVAGTTGISGGSQPLPTMDPYIGINFIIALEGIFPSRN